METVEKTEKKVGNRKKELYELATLRELKLSIGKKEKTDFLRFPRAS